MALINTDGCGVVADVQGLEVITSQRDAENLVGDGYSGMIVPTSTFEVQLDLPISGIEIQFDTGEY